VEYAGKDHAATAAHEHLPFCNVLRMFLDKKLQLDFSCICELPELAVCGLM
jgi:hypothetical protein